MMVRKNHLGCLVVFNGKRGREFETSLVCARWRLWRRKEWSSWKKDTRRVTSLTGPQSTRKSLPDWSSTACIPQSGLPTAWKTRWKPIKPSSKIACGKWKNREVDAASPGTMEFANLIRSFKNLGICLGSFLQAFGIRSCRTCCKQTLRRLADILYLLILT